MSKKNVTTAGDSVENTEQPTFINDLQEHGSVILTADTREKLAEMVATIPSDVHYATGAVGFNHDTLLFCLQLDIITI